MSDLDENRSLSPPDSRGGQLSSARPPGQSRRHPRLRMELDVTLQSESNFYMGLTENLSSAGLFIATHVSVPVGARIEVTFTLPSCSQPIRATGIVRWLREFSDTSDGSPGMGVEFETLDPADVISIRQFLNTRAPLLFDTDDSAAEQ